MAEAEEPQQQHGQGQEARSTEKMRASFSIWPPTQRTRDAVIDRLVETLSAPSLLSKRYGSIPPEEAAAAARVIEEEAFAAASAGAQGVATDDDGGIEILQVYSKEISKRVLEAVKSRAGSGSGSGSGSGMETPLPAAPETSEAFSSVEAESS